MGEFGHHFATGAGFAIDCWGAAPFLIAIGGKTYRFEDSDRFGPLLISYRGEVLDRQPDERSAFWKGYHMWRKDGRRMADDGKTCLWRDPKPGTFYRSTGGTRWALTEPEWEGAGYIEVPAPRAAAERDGEEA